MSVYINRLKLIVNFHKNGLITLRSFFNKVLQTWIIRMYSILILVMHKKEWINYKP
jgi:hypothetical protein